MLSDVPEHDESDSDTTLVNELEEDVTWFEVDGDKVDNIQIYHEDKEGCIGEEDGHQEERRDEEPAEQAFSGDIDMNGKSVALSGARN